MALGSDEEFDPIMTAHRVQLSDQKWHFQHGPIDLIIQAEGDPCAVEMAHAHAWNRFQNVLNELVAELPTLKTAIEPGARQNPCLGETARQMWQAAQAHASLLPNGFITPMACVAGAVAQEMLKSYAHASISRAWINNGGDIALHLTPGTHVDIAWVTHPERAIVSSLLESASAMLPHSLRTVDGQFRVDHRMSVRGVATSGWRGRSFSLGIADSVTVLGSNATQADAAASIIANAVNLDHPGIVRQRASSIKDDSDLGDKAVTVAVPDLNAQDVSKALEAGVDQAWSLREDCGVQYVILCLADQVRFVDRVNTHLPSRLGMRTFVGAHEPHAPSPVQAWPTAVQPARQSPAHREQARHSGNSNLQARRCAQ